MRFARRSRAGVRLPHVIGTRAGALQRRPAPRGGGGTAGICSARSRQANVGGPACGSVPRRSGPEIPVENQQPQSIEIGLGEKEAEGIYANVVFIAHSPAEVILDFARMLPGLPKARVFARIVMTPQHAKGLLGALEQNLKNYETNFGPIKVAGEPLRPGGKEMGFTS